ncbi:type II toxin-antitoxin system RelE/ParE family toxin [candidate division KSB1 bacterium]|nr:type II toxin-antitoxin system RelE/ParE family toxin [candidate division KSB1 bacterium]
MKHSSNKRELQKTKRFSRDIKKLSRSIQQEVFLIAQKLQKNIFDPELDVRKMTGLKGIYRVVVMTDYRMIFSFDAENIYLLRIGHRKDIYRDLEI